MATTNYIWHRDAVHADLNGATTRRYAREPDQFGSVISENDEQETLTHHFDVLGSTTEMTDAGAIVGSCVLWELGKVAYRAD